MFKTDFLSNDISKVDEYRIYSTKLNKFKSARLYTVANTSI